MLQQLLETKAAPERRAGSTMASIALHAAVITLAVVATVRGDPGPKDGCAGRRPAPGCPALPPVVYVDPTMARPGASAPSAPGGSAATMTRTLPGFRGVAFPDFDLPSIPTTGAFGGEDFELR